MLIFCCRQSIALRGRDKSADSNNRGNFLELMELRSRDNSLIRTFFSERRKNCQYTSPHSRMSEVDLSINGDQIKLHIANRGKGVCHYS